MIRNLFLGLGLMLACATGAFAQKGKATNTAKTTASKTTTTGAVSATSSDKTSVNDFGLSIIQAYFRRDCDFVWNALGFPIKSIESGEVFQSSPELKTSLCNENPLRTDMALDYRMYLTNYTPQVLNFTEFSQRYPHLVRATGIQEGDFFFDGSQVKDAGSTRLFRASDMARFIVRKVNGSWKIVAM